MKLLPHNDDLERQMIGQCLLDSKRCSVELAASDFHNPLWREAWSAIEHLDANSQTIDPFTVHEIVQKQISTVATSTITNATLGLVPTHDVTPYVRQLRDLAVRRYLIRQLSQQVEALESAAEVVDVLGHLDDKISYVRTDYGAKEERFVSLQQIVDEELAPALDQLHAGETHKIATGYEPLDRAFGGGLSTSDVMIVAGLPGGGKSAFVLQMAWQIARQNVPVAFLSGEMTNRENGLRMLSQMAKFYNLNAVTHITASEREVLRQWLEPMRQLPIHFDSRTSDVRTLRPLIKALVKQKGVKVLIIDYIQLLKLDGADKVNRTERITEASQEIKRIANELEICVVEVAQFNRVGAKSGKPSMHDLEASSQLEKDASLIVIIDADEERRQDVTLRVVKGRNAGLSEITGTFVGPWLRFDLAGE